MLGRMGSLLRDRLAARPGGGAAGALLDESLLARLQKRSLVAHRAQGGGLPGEHRGRRLASSLEFADYRPYTPGDDFRRIDWNAYARLNTLLIKIPEAREDITLHLLLDVSRSMDWGEPSKLDYARQICAGLGYLALGRLDAVRVATLSGGRVVSRSSLFRGKLQAGELFRLLQGLAAGGETDLNSALASYATVQQPTGLSILVSDLMSPNGYEEGLGRLVQVCPRTVVLHLLSTQELQPEYAGDLELWDVETGELVEVSVGLEALGRYRGEVASWQEAARSYCVGRGIGYVQVRTDRPIEQTLLADFRRAGLVR